MLLDGNIYSAGPAFAADNPVSHRLPRPDAFADDTTQRRAVDKYLGAIGLADEPKSFAGIVPLDRSPLWPRQFIEGGTTTAYAGRINYSVDVTLLLLRYRP